MSWLVRFSSCIRDMMQLCLGSRVPAPPKLSGLDPRLVPEKDCKHVEGSSHRYSSSFHVSERSLIYTGRVGPLSQKTVLPTRFGAPPPKSSACPSSRMRITPEGGVGVLRSRRDRPVLPPGCGVAAF